MPIKKTDPCWVTPESMSKFYTYALLDEGGQPFYIGKGKGYRVNNHVKPSLLKETSHKVNKIKKLISKHGFVRREILSYHDDETSAYDMEEFLIQQYGLFTEGGTLTNVVKGRNELPAKAYIENAKRTRARSISDAEIIEFHSKYLAGEITIATASKYLNVSSGYLSAVFRGEKMKHLNLPTTGPVYKFNKYSILLVNQVLHMREKGMTYKSISDELGISKTSVSRILTNKEN